MKHFKGRTLAAAKRSSKQPVAIEAKTAVPRPFPYVNRTVGVDEAEADILFDELCLKRMEPAFELLKTLPGPASRLPDVQNAKRAAERLTDRSADPEALQAIADITLTLLRYLSEEANCWSPDLFDDESRNCVPPVTILFALAEYAARCLRSAPAENLRLTAQSVEAWPCMVDQKDLVKGTGKSPTIRQWFESLELGTCTTVKSRSSSDPSLYAQRMVETIEINRDSLRRWTPERRAGWRQPPQWVLDCETLPPLNKESWPRWFDVGWNALLEASKGNPEKVTDLKPLGRYRKERGISKDSPNNARTKAANIRDGIKTSLKQAFKSLVKG